MDQLSIKDALERLQKVIGDGNAERGFHDEGDRLHGEYLDGARHSVTNLTNYQIAKLALIGTEVTEAIEELRNGRDAEERYYSGGYDEDVLEDWDKQDLDGNPRKPEGVPSELADVVIRAFDFAAEHNFGLAEVILEKLAYNETRGRMHGGKKI